MDGKSILQHSERRFVSLWYSVMPWSHFMYRTSESCLLLRGSAQNQGYLCPEEPVKRTQCNVQNQQCGELGGVLTRLAEPPGSPSQLSSIFASTQSLQICQRSTHYSNSVIKQRARSLPSFHVNYNCFEVIAELIMYLGKSKCPSPPGGWFQGPRRLLVTGGRGIKRA